MSLKRRFPRAWYAPGWSAVPIRDARLKGWSAPDIGGPDGSTAEVIRIEDRVLGPPHAKASMLYIQVRVTTPKGASWISDALLGRPRRAEVFELSELADYLDRIADGRHFERFRDDQERAALLELDAPGAGGVLRWADGPPLSPTDFLQCLELVETSRALLGGDASGAVSISRQELLDVIDMALLAGRRIAEAEVPGQLQRTKALAEARRRAEAAKAWWQDGAAWAQKIIDEWPLEARFSLASLASHMWEGWRRGPLGKVVARPGVRYLETQLLPQWRDSGLITVEP